MKLADHIGLHTTGLPGLEGHGLKDHIQVGAEYRGGMIKALVAGL
jgi:hypothetical protein